MGGGGCITFFLSNKNCNDSDVFAVSFIFLFPYRTVLFFWLCLWSLEYQTFLTFLFSFFFFVGRKSGRGGNLVTLCMF